MVPPELINEDSGDEDSSSDDDESQDTTHLHTPATAQSLLLNDIDMPANKSIKLPGQSTTSQKKHKIEEVEDKGNDSSNIT